MRLPMPNLNALGTVTNKLSLPVAIYIRQLNGGVCIELLPADAIVPKRELEAAFCQAS